MDKKLIESLKKAAKDYFEPSFRKNEKEVFATSDGNLFAENRDNYARSWASKIGSDILCIYKDGKSKLMTQQEHYEYSKEKIVQHAVEHNKKYAENRETYKLNAGRAPDPNALKIAKEQEEKQKKARQEAEKKAKEKEELKKKVEEAKQKQAGERAKERAEQGAAKVAKKQPAKKEK